MAAADSSEVAASAAAANPSPNSPTNYAIFRKRFHIPSAWANRPAFRELDKHSYEKDNHVDTMAYVGKTLADMGYEGANVAMKHDYLCFMLEDLLRAKGIPFVSEADLRSKEYLELSTFVGNGKPVTPDLLLRFKGKRRLVDVYTGHKTNEEIKSKYKSNPVMYSVHIINTKFFRHDLTTQLPGLFTDEEFQYLEDNFSVFQTEHQYWKACFELKQILRNEHKNVEIKEFTFPANADSEKKKFAEKLVSKFHQAVQAACDDDSD